MVNLGDEVKDTVSGFTGIAIAKHSYLEGCDRISIQPVIDKDGKLPDSVTFDEPSLKCIKSQKVKRSATRSNPGGPEKYADTGRR